MPANLPKLSNIPKINKLFNTYNAAKTSKTDTADISLFGNSKIAVTDGFTSSAQASSATQLDINLECENVLNKGGSASNPFKTSGGFSTTAPLLNFSKAAQNTGDIGVLNNSKTGTTNNSSEQLDLSNASKSEIENYIDSFSGSGKYITSTELNALLANANLDTSQLEGLYSLAMTALSSTEDEQEKERLKYLMSELEDRITGDSEWQDTLDKIKNAASSDPTSAGSPSGGAQPSGGGEAGGGGDVDDSINGQGDELPVNFDDRIQALQQKAKGTSIENKINELAEGAKTDKTQAQQKEAQGKETQAAADKAKENAENKEKCVDETNKELQQKTNELNKKNKDVSEKQNSFNSAKTEETNAQTKYSEAQAAVNIAQAALDSATDSNRESLQQTLTNAKEQETNAERNYKTKKQERQTAEENLKKAQEERDKTAAEIKKMMEEKDDLKTTADEWKKTADELEETSKQQNNEAAALTNSANDKLKEMETLVAGERHGINTNIETELKSLISSL